ncbi:unnamed protein product [Sympodiomycopsis kandeliae]
MKIPLIAWNSLSELAARQASGLNGSQSVNTTIIPNPPQPPTQAVCTSPIYCPGPLLHAVQLAGIYPDSKTFVDKPTTKSQEDVMQAFSELGDGQGGNITQDEITRFVDENFGEVGSELYQPELGAEFTDSPKFLSNVTQDAVVREWMKTVHGYWPLLTRQQNTSASAAGNDCKDCVSSFVSFKESRPFVIPGGRFNEQYYFDSYYVVEGLLKSQLMSLARDIISNFGDLVDILGHIPNGNRVYYNNRSQPPLFIQMVDSYVVATNDTSSLPKWLPQMEKEHQFWINNRTVTVESPFSGKTYDLSHYRVQNSAPRPESYSEDYETVEYANQTAALNLSDADKALLYSDLASGAESGHDYSAARWSKRPTIDLEDTIPAQRFLNTHAQIPADLNAIMYRNEITLAKYLAIDVDSANGTLTANRTAERHYRSLAQKRKDGILDVLWDRERLWFYDFNMTANARATNWAASGVWPYWANIIPTQFLNSKIPVANRSAELQRSFSGIRYILDRYNGSLPTTLIETGQQWDYPNVWAPHTFTAIAALRQLPNDLASGALKAAPDGSFELVPTSKEGNVTQLGFASAADLPKQTFAGSNDTYVSDLGDVGKTSAQNGSDYEQPLINTGNAAASNETWRDALVRRLANRFVSSAMCSWHATGGQLNVSESEDTEGKWRIRVPEDILKRRGLETNTTGAMYEKFSTVEIDQAGAGGEYKVQTGFGWTNSLSLFLGAELGDLLQRPICPDVELTTSDQSA